MSAATVRRRRIRRWIVLAALLLCAGWLSRYAYLRMTLRPTPRPAYWEAKLAELDPPPPGAITEGQLAALLASGVFQSDPIIACVKNFDVDTLFVGEWNWARPEVLAARAYFRLGRFEVPRTRMSAAVRAGWRTSFDLLIVSHMFGSWEGVRNWGAWTVAHSRWARMAGRTDAAVEDWLTVVRMGRQSRRPQTMYAWTLEAALQDCVSLEILAACHERLGPVDSAGFAREVDEVVGPMPMMGEILRGEELVLRSSLEEVYVRDGGDWLDLATCVSIHGAWWSGTKVNVPRVWNLLSDVYDDYPTAVDRLEATLRRSAAIDDMAHLCAQEVRQGRLGILQGLPFFAYANPFLEIPLSVWGARTRLDAAMTSLALREYRRRNGQYPPDLQTLIPEYLHRLPIDTADMQPLRYSPTQEGYLLCSGGSDTQEEQPAFQQQRGPCSQMVFSRMKRRPVAR